MIPRFVSPRQSVTLAVRGKAEVSCAQCGLVPLQYAELECGHRFCSLCLSRALQVDGGRMRCGVCRRAVQDVRYHRSVLRKIEAVRDIACPHCEEHFDTLSLFQEHERQHPDFFQRISTRDLISAAPQSMISELNSQREPANTHCCIIIACSSVGILLAGVVVFLLM